MVQVAASKFMFTLIEKDNAKRLDDRLHLYQDQVRSGWRNYRVGDQVGVTTVLAKKKR